MLMHYHEIMEYTSNFKSGPFASFYNEVKAQAGMMFGLPDDEENELTPENVRAWITSHRKLFRRSKILAYRAMNLSDAQINGLRPGAELGQHWSFELQEDNFGLFDVGGATTVVVFTAEIGARDVDFPLSVGYNCLFPHENELFLEGYATPVIRSIRRYSFSTGQYGDEERPDLIGKAMKV
jgi:hypothetical protein